MKWSPSEMHWMHRMHMPHAHAIHLHPLHWLGTHPLVSALLIATLIAAAIVGLARMANTGIRMETLKPFEYPAMYPYGSAY